MCLGGWKGILVKYGSLLDLMFHFAGSYFCTRLLFCTFTFLNECGYDKCICMCVKEKENRKGTNKSHCSCKTRSTCTNKK